MDEALIALAGMMIKKTEFTGAMVPDGPEQALLTSDGASVGHYVRPETSRERSRRIAAEVVPVVTEAVRHQIRSRLEVLRVEADTLYADPGGSNLLELEAFVLGIETAILLTEDDPEWAR